MDEVLGESPIHIILSKLDPNDTARIACVNKRFKAWASQECFWSAHCSKDLSLSSPVDPQGNPAPSFKAAYRLWRLAFKSYPWPLVTRGKVWWEKIESWLGSNFPEVLRTLQRGAREEVELDMLEESMEVNMPVLSKLIYRLMVIKRPQIDY